MNLVTKSLPAGGKAVLNVIIDLLVLFSKLVMNLTLIPRSSSFHYDFGT